MLESRWGRRAGPILATIGLLLAVAGTAVGAPARGERPPPDCGSGGGGSGVPARPAWFALDPVLEHGALVGQRLLVGAIDGDMWAISLPAEAFATGPVDGRILYGWDDGSRSVVRRFHAGRGCVTTVATSEAVIRSAIADPVDDAIHEHRVSRSDRADLGIWRRSTRGEPERVLEGLPADARFGVTWRTELAWSTDADRLVAATCGEVACRFRIIDRSGAVASVTDPDHGALVGFGDGRLVVRGACQGMPCPLLAVDLERGTTALLAGTAGPAVLIAGDDATTAVAFTQEATGGPIRYVAVHGGPSVIVDASDDVVPIPAGGGRGADLPPGWFLAGPGAAALPQGAPHARTLALPIRRLDEVWP